MGLAVKAASACWVLMAALHMLDGRLAAIFHVCLDVFVSRMGEPACLEERLRVEEEP